jgi:hypothetical protein
MNASQESFDSRLLKWSGLALVAFLLGAFAISALDGPSRAASNARGRATPVQAHS